MLKKLAFVAALALSTAPAAAANFIYDFSFNSGFGAGSGQFTLSSDPTAGLATVTGLSGTLGVDAIALLAPGTYAGNDNLFKAASPHFNFGGVSFSAGGLNYNLYNRGGAIQLCGRTSSCQLTATSAFVTSAVPEPATWAMMIFGFGLAGFSLRRRQRVAYA